MTNKVSCDKVEQADGIINNLHPDKNVTEEEFQNFMHRVTEVGRYLPPICKIELFNKFLCSRKYRKEVSVLRSKGARMWKDVSRRNPKTCSKGGS